MAEIIRSKIPLFYEEAGIGKSLLTGDNLANAEVIDLQDNHGHTKLRFLNPLDSEISGAEMNAYTNYALNLGYDADWILKHRLKIEGEGAAKLFIFESGGDLFLTNSGKIPHISGFIKDRLEPLYWLSKLVTRLNENIEYMKTSQASSSAASGTFWYSMEKVIEAFSLEVPDLDSEFIETASHVQTEWYGNGDFTNATIHPAVVYLVYPDDVTKNTQVGLPFKYSKLGVRSITWNINTGKVEKVVGALDPSLYLSEHLDENYVYEELSAFSTATSATISSTAADGDVDSIRSYRTDMAARLGLGKDEILVDNETDLGRIRKGYLLPIGLMCSYSHLQEWVVQLDDVEFTKLVNPNPVAYSTGEDAIMIQTRKATMKAFYCSIPLLDLHDAMASDPDNDQASEFAAQIASKPGSAIIYSKLFDQPDLSFGNNGEVFRATKLYADAVSAGVDVLGEKISEFEGADWTIRQADNRAKTQMKATNVLAYVSPDRYGASHNGVGTSELHALIPSSFDGAQISIDDESITLSFNGDSVVHDLSNLAYAAEMYAIVKLFNESNPLHVNSSVHTLLELETAFVDDGISGFFVVQSEFDKMDALILANEGLNLKGTYSFNFLHFDSESGTAAVNEDLANEKAALNDYAMDPNLLCRGGYAVKSQMTNDQWYRLLTTTVGCHNESISGIAQSLAFVGRLSNQTVTVTV